MSPSCCAFATIAGLDDVVDEVPVQGHGSVVEEVEEHEDAAVGKVHDVELREVVVYAPMEPAGLIDTVVLTSAE